MDRSILWRAAAAQVLAVAALSLILAVTLPHSFFDDWGWITGPVAWLGLRGADGVGASPQRPRGAAGRRPRRDPQRDRGGGGRPLAGGGDRGGRVRGLVCVAGAAARRSGVDLGIEGRTALVMAASKGIGRGIADALAREGARVAISSRSEEELREAAAEIDGEVEVFPADTGDLDRLGELPGEVSDALGQIEILVLNTGGPPYGRGARQLDRGMGGGLSVAGVGAARADGAVLPGMRERGWGRIVNVSSTSIREPIPALTLSNANRMAALGLLKTLADEVAGDGITVNTVATGMFATERLADPQGSLEGAEEAAKSGSRPTGSAARGVRRPGRLPVLGAGRLSHRSCHPDRRRPAPFGTS